MTTETTYAETAQRGHGSIIAETADAGAGAAPAAAPRFATIASLRHRDYRLLWFGTLLSSSGQWIQQVSISWLTYHLTDSPFLLGAVNGLRALPLLMLGPFGGVAADRLDRKRLMLSTQLFLVALTAAFATIIVTGNEHIWNIILFTLLTGVAWSFNQPVRQSIVPNLVPRQDLMNAVALNSAGFNMTRIIGPSLAGLLIATAGIAGNFYLQTVAYAGVAAMVWMMTIPPSPRSARDASMLSTLAEGARYVWRHPTLRGQMSLALIPVVIALPYTSLMPIFARDVLQVGAVGFGALMSASGIGALISSLVLATVGNRVRSGSMLFVSMAGLGAMLILFSQSSHFPLSLALLTLAGGFQMTFLTTNQTLLQTITPDEFRGRVMGIYMLNQGLLPLGSLLAGTMADLWSAPLAVFVMGALVVALSAGAFLLMPEMRRR